MFRAEEPFPELTEALFDRLADGELGDQEQRELLAMLDEQPDGWRRCALAFCEAQALRRELTAWAGTVEACRAPHKGVAATSTAGGLSPAMDCSRPRRRKIFGYAALAAAACLGAVLGACGGRWQLLAQNAGSGTLEQPPARAQANVPRPTAEVAHLADSPPLDQTDGEAEWSTLRLTISAAASEKAGVIDLPVVHASTADPQWLAEQPSAIAPDVLDAWRAAGHRVRRQQGVWPIQLEDGRRLLLPVEEIEVDAGTL